METLKIAAFWWAGRRHVGRLSADERDVTPLALGDRAHAVRALALVEAMAEGAPVPKPSGAALPLSAVKLDAPIPAPRRNIFCVGLNYRAHAAEFAASGVGGPRPPQQAVPEVPVIFSKVPESVIAPEAAIRIPSGLSESAGITLYPGDIIATGTPAGVGIGFDPPKFLRRGDRVRIHIEGIGTLSNPVQ